jgi:transcription antitermination factor NusG
MRRKPKGAKPLSMVNIAAVATQQGEATRPHSRISMPQRAGVSEAAGAWHAIWTRSHCEHTVARQLQASRFETFLPEMSAWSRRAGQLRLIPVPMFAGYLFVRGPIAKHRYLDLLKARGVVRILGDGWDRLAPVPDSEVEAIRRVVTANVPVLPHAHLQCGQRVVVVEGPLAGVEGLYVHDRPQKGRLVLSIDLLGRSVAVDIDGTAVVPSTSRNSA